MWAPALGGAKYSRAFPEMRAGARGRPAARPRWSFDAVDG
jgi:hypothetical protein